MRRIIEYGFLEKDKTIQATIPKDVVLVGGCFDIVHVGHIRFLTNARQQGSFLVVALEGDEFIRTRKKRAPIQTQKDRAEIVSSLQMVDMVISLPFFKSYKEYLNLVKMIRPCVIAVTEGDPSIELKKKQARAIGARVVEVIMRIKPYASGELARSIS